MKTTTTWKTGLAFSSQFENHTIELNGASNEQGERLGFSPKALLLSGLAGCSGIDVVDILTKMKVEFTAIAVEAEADQTESHPKVFTGIDVTYRVATAEENFDKVFF
nr:OsmC family protein [Chitinophagaceae bacterium]